MRIRTIKPEFYKHDGLFDLEEETKLPIRIAFTGLWCAADREGRFKWKPRRLKAEILPYDDVDFSRVLDALVTRGFVVHYTSEEGEFGMIPKFSKHQVINNREMQSNLPDPDDCEVLTRESRVDDACRKGSRGKEGKGKEGNMEGKGKDNSRVNDAEYFEDFWKLTKFPKRKQDTKGDMKKKYFACLKAKLTPEEILFSSDIFAEVHSGDQYAIGMRKFLEPDTVREYLTEDVRAKGQKQIPLMTGNNQAVFEEVAREMQAGALSESDPDMIDSSAFKGMLK